MHKFLGSTVFPIFPFHGTRNGLLTREHARLICSMPDCLLVSLVLVKREPPFFGNYIWLVHMKRAFHFCFFFFIFDVAFYVSLTAGYLHFHYVNVVII